MESERATFAYEQVAQIAGLNPGTDLAKHYRALVRSFPAMILSNGYGTAMAFLYSKRCTNRKNKDNEHGRLYGQIAQWLRKQKIFPDQDEYLMKYVVSRERDEYRLLSGETLALLKWLKRFAEGMISDE